MTDENETNETALAVTSVRYEDALWQTFFEIWLYLADRNCARTREVFLKEFRNSPGFDEDRIPTVRQIQYKAKRENWDLKANAIIKRDAPMIDDNQLSRLLIATNKAIDLADRIVSLEFYDGKTASLMVAADMAKELMRLRGLGTAGVLGVPTLKVEVKNEATESAKLSVEERSQLQRNRILAGKQQKKLIGKK